MVIMVMVVMVMLVVMVVTFPSSSFNTDLWWS